MLERGRVRESGRSRPAALFLRAPSGRFGHGRKLPARPPEGEQGAEPGGTLGRIRVLPPNRAAEVKRRAVAQRSPRWVQAARSRVSVVSGSVWAEVHIVDHTEHATGTGQRSPAMAYVECRVDGAVGGAGQDTSALTASIPAVLSAVNRRV
ncbi:alpha-isopropylmalate synthase regulatory domain-containing protein [Streptomyces sp. NBC_01744]|uniref:alpha-isopropylmalate synthase regulatory domain-containing protein n=1 Tax=Streptomyces sp. NBC_01744 TaxID=2975927 RepID=UPI003D9A1EB3